MLNTANPGILSYLFESTFAPMSIAQRKLSAVLFADIKGFTAIMQANEEKGLQFLNRFKKTVEREVEAYAGKIIQFYGDGCLATFDSVSQAVSCAEKLQQAFQKSPEIPVRIGLHSGEIVLREGNVYGNTVNIASRIESMGTPGAVLLSSSIQNQIKHKEEFKLTSLGEHAFKNVSGKMQVFALANEGLVVPKKLGNQASNTNSPTGFKSSYAIWAAGLLLLAIAGFAFSQFRQSPNTDTDLYTRYLIMPFEVQAGTDLQYLGTGMVDLLSANLDGVGSIRTIDPNIVLTTVDETQVDVRNPALASSTFANLQPKRVVLGSVVKLGSQYRFNASLYDENAELITKAEALTNSEEGLPTVIDELSQQLISRELKSEGLEPESFAALSTSNTKALKKYLIGEQFRRESRFREAVQAFEESVELDSTLALAWYRLYSLDGWGAQSKFSLNLIFQKIDTLKERLPEKFQLLFEMATAFYSWDFNTVEDKYKKGVAQFGEDVDLLMLYGDYLYHTNCKFLKPQSEARPYFEKVIRYRPNEKEAVIHLIKLAYESENQQMVNELLTRLDPKSSFWVESKIIQVLGDKVAFSDAELDSISNASNLRWTAPTEIRTPWNSVELNSLFQSILDRNQTWTESDQGILDYILSMNRGQVIENLPVLLQRRIFYNYTRYIGDPVLTPQKDHFLQIYSNFLEQPDINPYAQIMRNVYNAILGNEKDFIETRKWLTDRISENSQTLPIRMGVLYNDVIWYRNTGQHDKALLTIDTLLESKVPPDFSNLYAQVFGIIHAIKGEILFEQEQYEEALAWYTSVEDMVAYAALVGPIAYRKGLCLERLGQKQEALRHLNYFLELFKDCDPVFYPMLEDAKEARLRLVEAIG